MAFTRPAADELPGMLKRVVQQHVPGGGAIANWRPAERGLST
jgi:hypothetical protein